MRRLTVVLGALLLAGSARAQMPEVPLGKWWKRPRAVEELRLSADQQERLEQVFSKNRKAFIDLKAEVERRQVDMEELFSKKDSEPKKLAAASEGLEQARARLRKAHTQMIIEMREVLSADQWQKLVDGFERMRDMNRMRRNRRDQRMGVEGPSSPRESPE